MHLIIFTLTYLEHQVISSQDIDLGARRTKSFRRARITIAASKSNRTPIANFYSQAGGPHTYCEVTDSQNWSVLESTFYAENS